LRSSLPDQSCATLKTGTTEGFRWKLDQFRREILAKYGITQDQAASLIKKETNQKVGTRKVRSWLANLEAKSARSCQNWAVTALKKRHLISKLWASNKVPYSV